MTVPLTPAAAEQAEHPARAKAAPSDASWSASPTSRDASRDAAPDASRALVLRHDIDTVKPAKSVSAATARRIITAARTVDDALMPDESDEESGAAPLRLAATH